MQKRASALLLCSSLCGCGQGQLQAFSNDPHAAGGTSSGVLQGDLGGSGEPQAFTTRLIDDFEDGDTRVNPKSESWWYAFNDNTGEQQFQIENVSGERSNSSYAAHTFGEYFTTWGAGLGVDLAGVQDARNPEEPFDASQFAGISFWAKTQADSVRKLRVDLLSPCGDDCASYSGVSIELSHQWQQYTVLFSELEPRQNDSDFDESQLVHIQFFFLGTDRFDLWVDDLSVVSKDSIK
jgi:hypothetical protein